MSLLYDPKLKPPNESTAAGTDDGVLVLFEFDPEFHGRPLCQYA